jgi:hypothetical protein
MPHSLFPCGKWSDVIVSYILDSDHLPIVFHILDHVNISRILVGNPKGKRPLGRPRQRWVDNITIYLREIGGNGVDWIDMALVNTVLNFRVT